MNRLDICANNAGMIVGSETTLEALVDEMPSLRRSGTPEEVAFTVQFLADPRASYITGQMIIVDGGNSVPEDRNWRS